MRNPKSDCTTPPPAATPAKTVTPADSTLWLITEKGLRAEGAASMRAMAARLRKNAAELEKTARRLNQELPQMPTGSGEPAALEERRGTVCGRYRDERRVPDLRLSGQWLERAGFDRGRKFHVQVHSGRITLRAEPTLAQ